MKRRLVLYSGAALTMLAAWYFLLYGPLTQKRADIGVRTEQARQQIIEFRRIMAELPVYLETHRSLEQARSNLNESLYARDEILGLFDLIAGQAKTLQLKVLEISPPVEELLLLNNLMPSADKPPFLNLTIKLQGGYVNFGKYVAFIESAEFFRGVNICQITSSPDDDEPAHYLLGFQALLGQLEGTS